MMQIDYDKQSVKLAINGSIQTLSKTLPDPETVDAGLQDIKKFEDIVKSFWEGWWQLGYVFPQLVISSNAENLPEWAKSRLKHIDFDVHFSPSEEARRTLNEIFSTPNDLFQWFAMFYLRELSRADEFSDDELSVARKCMLKL